MAVGVSRWVPLGRKNMPPTRFFAACGGTVATHVKEVAGFEACYTELCYKRGATEWFATEVVGLPICSSGKVGEGG